MKRMSAWNTAGAALALPVGIALLMGAANKPAPKKAAPPAKKTAPAKKAPAKAAPPRNAAPPTNRSGTANDKPAPPGAKTSKEVYKNILVLGDLPADKMLEVMQSYTQALGVQCSFCHTEDFAADIPHKKITRNMIILTREINKNPSAQNRVTCFTCHQGDEHTVNSPQEAEKRAEARKAAEMNNAGQQE